MRRWIALLVSFFICVNAFGKEIWVTYSQLSSQEKLQALAEEHREQMKEGDFISSFDALMSHPVGEGTLNVLLKIEDEAQEDELDGHFARSLTLYQQLKNKLESVPNVSGVERITLSTLIHLAELHDLLNDGEGMVSWKLAHAFSPQKLSTGPDFSPKAVEKFNSLKVGRAKGVLEIIAPPESVVFIDGQKVKPYNEHFQKKLEPGHHHADVLVPGSEWMSKSVMLQSSETREVVFRPEPLVEGTCDDPHFTGSGLPSKTKLLVNFGSCERIYFEKAWFNFEGQRLDSRLDSPLESLPPKATPTSIMNEMLPTAEDTHWWTRATRSTWFWVGVSAVALGTTALIIQNQNQQTVVVPSNNVR